jgi:hypothetical protein
MYLTSGDYAKSAQHLRAITFTTSTNYRYQLDRTFATGSWTNIFTGIDSREHILTVWFNKANQQQNDFQRLFDHFAPNKYMLKPTRTAVDFWEAIFRSYTLIIPDNTKPQLTRLSKISPGIPGDWYRGYGASFIYVRNDGGAALSSNIGMLMLKMQNDIRTVNSMMDGYDTVVYKYSIGRDPYEQDANFIVYRAGGIQLYLAEIYNRWSTQQSGGFIAPNTSFALDIINDGSIYDVLASRTQLGIRGRAGFSIVGGNTHNGIEITDPIYKHDPYTNEVTGFEIPNFIRRQEILEDEIMNERARELAFEGERFYDLMRVAKRRNDPSYLAKKVSAKYPSGMRQAIYNKLMDEKNWYINMFD